MNPVVRQPVATRSGEKDFQKISDGTALRLVDTNALEPGITGAPTANASPAVATIDVVALRRNPPRLLNFRELCVLLDISERHARDLIAERKLPSIRLGARLLFDTAKIFAALERLSA